MWKVDTEIAGLQCWACFCFIIYFGQTATDCSMSIQLSQFSCLVYCWSRSSFPPNSDFITKVTGRGCNKRQTPFINFRSWNIVKAGDWILRTIKLRQCIGGGWCKVRERKQRPKWEMDLYANVGVTQKICIPVKHENFLLLTQSNVHDMLLVHRPFDIEPEA